MIQRFQIDDLVAQDASGVVFRALDLETDAVVAIRRFFPFGPDGGGLKKEEQSAYDIAVARLASIHHPGLRSVICGACDPIDGMPFIATEWIEGKSLHHHIERRPLSATDAISIITRALEVCELLSGVLAEEGIWVETDIQTIIVGEKGGGRGVTFWISPLKWLSRCEDENGLDSIILLTEQLMGWQGQNVGERAGRGLGGWLKWLRQTSKTTNLKEARDTLAASTGMEPPVSAKQLVRQAARPNLPVIPIKLRKKKSVSGTLIAIVLLTLTAGGLVWWGINRKDPDAPKTSGSLAEMAAKLAKEDAATSQGKTLEMKELAAAMNGKSDEPAVKAAEPAPPASARIVRAPGKVKVQSVFSPDDTLIAKQNGKQVTVEGVLEQLNTKDKAIYLLFTRDRKHNTACGIISPGQVGGDLTVEALGSLLGQKIQITGQLSLQKRWSGKRPEVSITNREFIVEVHE